MNDQNLTRFLMSVVNVRGIEDGVEEAIPRRTPASKEETDEAKKMIGFDALEFKYTVPFPLSLVISSKTVVRYQILFRYLLSMRHLESLLVNSWEDHNKVISWTNKSKDRKLEMWKRRAWTLRARMLNFVQQFMYYCTAEVIEPNWHALMTKVNSIDKSGKLASRTVDELMEDHVDFLDTCLKECMLMNPKLLKVRNSTAPSYPFPNIDDPPDPRQAHNLLHLLRLSHVHLLPNPLRRRPSTSRQPRRPRLPPNPLPLAAPPDSRIL